MNMKTIRKFENLLILLFIILSFLYISPTSESMILQHHSSGLKKITVKNGNTERISYVNENGEITIAADLKYATILIMDKRNSKLEKYYDDHGQPARRYSGEYAILREYDEHGNIVRNTSLDVRGNPILNTSGYAIEERRYNAAEQATSIRYFDTEGYPVRTVSNGYGKNNEYDDSGRICRTTYIDEAGNPTMTSKGYAIVSFSYYESDGPYSGKVERELYYDSEGNPVSLALGQYGVHKEYDENGRAFVLTYLDADGKPTATNRGYTTVVQTFWPDNSVATEQYFGINGEPYYFPEGQAGVRKEDGRIIYLDGNGAKLFNLKTLLYNQTWLVIVFSLIVIILSFLIDIKWNIVLLIIYIGIIAYLTLIYRDNSKGETNLQLFWSYRKLFIDSDIRADILKNIWLFIPLGAILYQIYPHVRILLVSIGLSILIEAIQYFAGIGFCELDDIISNGLGGAIGYGMGCQAKKIRDLFLNERHKCIRTAKD